ncbi:MAG TPA: class I SAM-dependent methyltransferase [Candidatus Saccharimonadia bacterium]|nr:class I SAM-dependent methyltransferase [Candidatus Saccharimonadia bacterium]
MLSLCEILAKYDTDKNTYHSYGPVYETLLAPIREKAKIVLEVGIRAGGSIRAWRDYFPNATIFGVDNRQECIFQEERIVSVLADEREPGYMTEKLLGLLQTGSVDFIVDDGSHDFQDQIMMLFTLWPFLKMDGIYVVEDCNDATGPLSRMPQVTTFDLRKPGRTHDDILQVYVKKR